MDTGINIFETQPHLAGQPAVDLTSAPPAPATPPRRRRLLLASAAVLAVAAAGGAFLLSPYNHVIPVDTGRLGAQVRQLAASVAPGASETPVMAPAARLATAPRSQAKRPSRGQAAPADPDAQMRELLALRSGSDSASPGTASGAAGQEAGQPEEASSPSLPSPPLSPAARAAPAVPSGAGAGVALAARPAAPALPAAAPSPPDGSAAMEPGMPPPASQAVVPGLVAPASPPAAPVPAETAGRADAVAPADTRLQEPAVQGIATQAASAPASNPSPAIVAGDAAGTPPTPSQPDPVAVAIALQPGPMTRSNQIDVLHLVTRLGISVRDLRTENAALRADVKASSDKVDNAVADFERRLALAEGRGAVNAAMGDVDAASDAPASPASPSAPAPRSARLSRGPASQPVSLQTQAAAAGGPARYKVQAASPSLAMLSELDLSGGEGSQLQVRVGDQLPGYGRVGAIQQQGMAWVVKTDRGTIQ